MDRRLGLFLPRPKKQSHHQRQQREEHEQDHEQPDHLPAAATAEQGVELALVTGLSGYLQAQFVASFRVVARFVFPEIATERFILNSWRHEHVEVQRVRKRKACRPDLAASAGRQEHPDMPE